MRRAKGLTSIHEYRHPHERVSPAPLGPHPGARRVTRPCYWDGLVGSSLHDREPPRICPGLFARSATPGLDRRRPLLCPLRFPHWRDSAGCARILELFPCFLHTAVFPHRSHLRGFAVLRRFSKPGSSEDARKYWEGACRRCTTPFFCKISTCPYTTYGARFRSGSHGLWPLRSSFT